MANGLAEGYGIGHFFEMKSPNTYTGYWKQGHLNGYGEAVFDNGDFVGGMFKDSQRKGQGTYKSSNGDVYEGNLKHYDLSFFLKLSLLLTLNQLTIAPVLECYPQTLEISFIF
jgi:hypothetical protein